jgi:hypothetical protein
MSVVTYIPGSLVEDIQMTYNRLKQGLKCRFNCSRLILSLNHYFTDAHSVGQINKDLWHNKDNILDAAGELIINKNMKLKSIDNNKYNSNDMIDMLYDSMKIINCKYYKAVKKNLIKFCFTDLGSMVRDEIYYGALYTDLAVRIAIREL